MCAAFSTTSASCVLLGICAQVPFPAAMPPFSFRQVLPTERVAKLVGCVKCSTAHVQMSITQILLHVYVLYSLFGSTAPADQFGQSCGTGLRALWLPFGLGCPQMLQRL